MNIELDHLKVSDYGATIEYNLERVSGTTWVAAMQTYLENVTPFNIALALSGGADSEAVATILHNMGRPFTPLIFDYAGKNQHDTHYAVEWCEANGYYPRVISFDPVGLWVEQKDHCLEIAEMTHCTSPQYLAYMKMIEAMLPFGHPLMCVGEPELKFTGQAGDIIELTEKPMHFSVEMYCRARGFDATALPFQLDKDVMQAWICDPFWETMNPGQSSKERKADFYQHYLGIEPRVKFNGFENVQEEDQALRAELVALYPEQDIVITTNLNI